MSNTAKKISDPSETVSKALVSIKGYKPKDEQKFADKTTKTPPITHPRPLAVKYRMPIIFGFSVFICFFCFVSLVLLLGSPRSDSTSRSAARVVTVNKEPVMEFTTILVPKQDIRPGTVLDESLFQIEVRPKVSTPATALTSIAQIASAQSKVVLVAGQPVMDSMVKNAKTINPVVASIHTGARAITIQVNATSSVEGWATAGAFVDVHWVTNTFGPLSVNLLAQNAKILSAERQVESKANQAQTVVPTTVTLLVSDKDAQKISLASTSGELKLHLRGSEDVNKPALASSTTIYDLLGKSDAKTSGSLYVRNKQGGVDELVLQDGQILVKKSAA
jgi:pilus assembly protein CpaB